MTTDEVKEIYARIDKISWAVFKTAYGSAVKIPVWLKALFVNNKVEATDAAYDLECSLCHQHAFISSAALPAYDFLMIALEKLDDEIKVEILGILDGFAHCTSNSYYEACAENDIKYPEYKKAGLVLKQKWEFDLKERLISDIEIFKKYSLIYSSANSIIENLLH